MSREDIMSLVDLSNLKQLLNKSKKEVVVVRENKCCTWKKVLGVIVALAAVAGIAYALYRYFHPKYEDEFLDDFDDDLDDDFDDDLDDLSDDVADIVKDVQETAEDVKDTVADQIFEEETKPTEEA